MPPPSVLVVDDNPELVNTFLLILRRWGYQVEPAGDGMAALEKFEKRKYDVVLMDMVMPRMNGLEAFERIREADPSARVILMTAYCEEESLQQAREDGIFQTVPKPVDLKLLADLLRDATSDHRVLVVDDNPEFCQSLARALEVAGFRVETAQDGNEAVAKGKAKRPTVALVDLRMPGINGLQTYLKLKENNPELVGIIMTAYRDEARDLVSRAIAAKAAGCLYKPFDVSQVIALVKSNAG
ncbi:MAG: response regulator [Chloroflexi bacterium]|nr:response regulator [Chloroflexota bacterium]